MRIRNLIPLIFTFLCFQTNYGQELDSIPDFLKNSSYDDIYESYLEVWEDTLKSKVYLNAWLKKATKENNTKKKSAGLTLLSYYAKTESKKLHLLDSAIALGRAANESSYQILPYSFKAGYYLEKGSYELALKNYLRCLEVSEKANNIEYQNITKHNIGILKLTIGKNEEAIKLFKETLLYVLSKKAEDPNGYGETLLSLSEAYLKNKQLDSASIYIEEGLKIAKSDYKEALNKFMLLKGIQLFFSGRLELAESTIEHAIFNLNKNSIQSKHTQFLGSFYLGKINALKGSNEKAAFHFLQLDSLFNMNKFLYPEAREGYEFLIAHYKERDQKAEELRFVNKLLAFDSISKIKNSILASRLVTEFDTPMLLKEKEVIIGELQNEKKYLNYFLLSSFFVILAISIVLIHQYQKRKSYKRKFLELVNNQESVDTSLPLGKSDVELSSKSNSLNISDQIVTNIIEGLKSFEQEKKFLNKDITSAELARILGTNTKYLSQVINHYKKKSFSNYIKDLRIDHSIQQLKTDSSLRNFSIQGIAQEMGFNSTESFSSAFRKKTGIKPSYFIREFNNLQTHK